MRILAGSSFLLLAATACVLPSGDEDAPLDVELAEEESALSAPAVQSVSTLKPLPYPVLPVKPIVPILKDPQFVIVDPAELYCQSHPEEADALFVVTRSGHCDDVPGIIGTWYGEVAFPGVVTGLCRYVWHSTWGAPPEYWAIEGAAALTPDEWLGPSKPRINADCRQVLASCHSVASCEAASRARVPAWEEISSRLVPGASPCPACRGRVASRELMAVLSPELATTNVVEVVADVGGVPISTTLKPMGRQVVSFTLDDRFPDTTEVRFYPYLTATGP